MGILPECSALGSQQKTLDPQGLELQKVVRHEVGVGNRTQVFWKDSQCRHSQLFSPPHTPNLWELEEIFPSGTASWLCNQHSEAGKDWAAPGTYQSGLPTPNRLPVPGCFSCRGLRSFGPFLEVCLVSKK